MFGELSKPSNKVLVWLILGLLIFAALVGGFLLGLDFLSIENVPDDSSSQNGVPDSQDGTHNGGTDGGTDGTGGNGDQTQDPCEGVVCADKCDGDTRLYDGECIDGKCLYSEEICEHACVDAVCTGWQAGEEVDNFGGSSDSFSGGSETINLDLGDLTEIDFTIGLRFGRKWGYNPPDNSGSVHWVVSDSNGQVWNSVDDAPVDTLGDPTDICPMVYDGVNDWKIELLNPTFVDINYQYDATVIVCEV